MSPRLRVLVPALLIVAVVLGALALTGGLGRTADVGQSGLPSAGGGSGLETDGAIGSEPTATPAPTPRPPLGGTELYGYVPYWQMTGSMADYLRSTPLTTMALFSVTARNNGSINTGPAGYRRITGAIGRRLIDEAHARDARVELVFSSFGAEKNGIFFGRLVPTPNASPGASPGSSTGPSTSAATPLPTATPAPPAIAPWHRTVDELVALAAKLGVDGINVDVELLDGADVTAYGEFLAALRAALLAQNPKARVTVATEAGLRGIGNAVAATAAGVDRLFLMGYDYHWSGSQPGATSPVDRIEGLYTLRWSINSYVEAGVPRDRMLLGLPLYGMRWRMAFPSRFNRVIGQGVTWVPNQHLDLLGDRDFHPSRDPLELAEVFWEQEGAEWLVTYYDSPETLRPKLALARDNGLAGAGFWAMGYARGLPGYVELMSAFRGGDVAREEAPPRP